MRGGIRNIQDRSEGCAQCRCLHCSFQSFELGSQLGREIVLQRGDRLECRPGSCLQFWTVNAGTAATCTTLMDGRRQIVGLEMSGSVVCGAMADAGSETWLEALSDCSICELDLSAQAETLRKDARFMALTFHLIHSRLEASLRHMTTLGRLDSQERLTLFLAEMAMRGRRDVDGTRHGNLSMSREDIADYLGLNAETVSRILSRIKKSGLVKFQSPTEYSVPKIEEIARRLPVPIPGLRSSPQANPESVV